jgi:Na+/melibiose symporter-like transporter
MAARSANSFSFADLILRVIFSVALVFLTYNPTQYSYVSWLLGYAEGDLPLVVLAGITLLICYVIYIRATLRSIGLFGIALAGAFTAALIWVLIDFGILEVDSGNALQWIVLATIAVILGIGLSWSHVRRLLSGQSDVDELDD